MSEKRVASRSDSQQAAERAAIKALSAVIGFPLVSKQITLQGQRFNVDGYYESQERIMLAEVWAHIGRAKAAQRNKVLSDLLKLALLSRLLSRERPGVAVTALIVFIDAAAARVIQNESWGALAAKEFGIEPIIVAIDPAYQDAVRAAQIKQDLRAIVGPDADLAAGSS